jgi:hypothetical protein
VPRKTAGAGGPPARLAGPRRTQDIDLNALVTPNLGLAVVALSVLLALALIGLVVQGRRVSRMERRLMRLTRGSAGNLQDVLESHLDTVARVVDDVDELGARAAVLEARSQRAFSRIGLVRFNPFEDTGGNQSFALALLDGREDGIVISSLHTRAATRIYAKAVLRGRSDGALSAEESEAVEIARSASAGRVGEASAELRASGSVVRGPSPAGSAPAGSAPAGSARGSMSRASGGDDPAR